MKVSVPKAAMDAAVAGAEAALSSGPTSPQRVAAQVLSWMLSSGYAVVAVPLGEDVPRGFPPPSRPTPPPLMSDAERAANRRLLGDGARRPRREDR